jgi:cyclophilin family peptidyl-prolyl cis-trans isomerase
MIHDSPAKRTRPVFAGAVFVAVLAFMPAACGAASPATPNAGSTTAVGSGRCPTAAPAALPAGETRTVTIKTAKGSIVIKVEANLGPRAAGNFAALTTCGFYDKLVFHRLVAGFVIQGGDPTGTGGGGPGYTFPDDPVTVPYARGVVAMANAGPNTNGSQFFIVLAQSSLAPSYSVFGRVVSGMDAVDLIASGQTTGPNKDKAVDPVAMDSVTVANP